MYSQHNNQWIYTATGIVKNRNFPTPLIVQAYHYQYLVEEMAKATQDIRYYTEGVNSYEDKEPYSKDLIWPEVEWTIVRDKRQADKEKE